MMIIVSALFIVHKISILITLLIFGRVRILNDNQQVIFVWTQMKRKRGTSVKIWSKFRRKERRKKRLVYIVWKIEWYCHHGEGCHKRSTWGHHDFVFLGTNAQKGQVVLNDRKKITTGCISAIETMRIAYESKPFKTSRVCRKYGVNNATRKCCGETDVVRWDLGRARRYGPWRPAVPTQPYMHVLFRHPYPWLGGLGRHPSWRWCMRWHPCDSWFGRAFLQSPSPVCPK